MKGFIPMRHGVQISKKHSSKILEDMALMEKIIYTSAIKSIMYVRLYIRLDVTFVLSVMSRFQANPSDVKCILKYLRRTKNLFLYMEKMSLSSIVTLT